MAETTQLRFLKANNPERLTVLVGALPFKVEIKSIMQDGKSYICFFTIMESDKKFTNELIKELSDGR